ncbi:MAG: tripartite tricarboxylate transporter TctB family protein [Pseudomonadota bacterium]
MQRTDRWAGLALALLGLAVMWSARAFPNVPGQKLGAGFLPMLVGAGLLLCAVALLVRSLRAAAYAGQADEARREHFGSSLVIIGAIVGYILLAERLGFLIVAPLCLVATFLALRVKLSHALLWALAGTIVVHVAFYKLLRVPLPWGVFRPFY